jgi:hypothetical protein
MADEEEHTCGKGVAANAVLPEQMASLLHAMADIYDNHNRSLNPGEAAGREEITAYTRLARDYRAAAAYVGALADEMRSYRDLPVAEHDMAALMDARSRATMEALVLAQEALLTPLSQRATEFRAMLEAMKSEAG